MIKAECPICEGSGRFSDNICCGYCSKTGTVSAPHLYEMSPSQFFLILTGILLRALPDCEFCNGKGWVDVGCVGGGPACSRCNGSSSKYPKIYNFLSDIHNFLVERMPEDKIADSAYWSDILQNSPSTKINLNYE
jgi:RecJ-like exonuclease